MTASPHVPRRRLLVAPALALLLSAGGLASGLGQEATPEAGRNRGGPYPVHIHAGSCAADELGDVVAPLTDLVAPRGGNEGNRAAIQGANSFTAVPLTLDQILAADHAINVHLSAERIDEYIACGEIGGARNADGSLVIGLSEQDGSGYSGIAYLSPGADGASTGVSVFVAETAGDRDRIRRRAGAQETPAAVGGETGTAGSAETPAAGADAAATDTPATVETPAADAETPATDGAAADATLTPGATEDAGMGMSTETPESGSDTDTGMATETPEGGMGTDDETPSPVIDGTSTPTIDGTASPVVVDVSATATAEAGG